MSDALNTDGLATQIKAVHEDMSKAWGEFRSELDTVKAEQTAETKQFIERVDSKLEDQEQKLNDLSLQLNRKGGYGTDDETEARESKARRKAWATLLKEGSQSLSQDERKWFPMANINGKSLSRTTDTTAGYLVPPPEFEADIIKNVVEISDVRGLARVTQISGNSILLPRRTGTFAAQWTAEQGTRSETTGLAYGQREIPAQEMYALVDMSNQLIEDSAFNMDEELQGEFAEQFAYAEGTAFVSGSGVGKPEGFTVNADVLANSVTTTTAAASGAITADDLIAVTHDIKDPYHANATWGMNRATLKFVRQLKDNNNQYLWAPGGFSGALSYDIAPTILGRPYKTMQAMPDLGSLTFPVVYADFKRFYRIVDRVEMALLRDEYTQATNGNIRFLCRKRVGGQVVLPEAGRLLKCHS